MSIKFHPRLQEELFPCLTRRSTPWQIWWTLSMYLTDSWMLSRLVFIVDNIANGIHLRSTD